MIYDMFNERKSGAALNLIEKNSVFVIHTIDPIRVNAMMSQSPEFLKAFQCSADSRMNAKDKCNLWKREFP